MKTKIVCLLIMVLLLLLATELFARPLNILPGDSIFQAGHKGKILTCFQRGVGYPIPGVLRNGRFKKTADLTRRKVRKLRKQKRNNFKKRVRRLRRLLRVHQAICINTLAQAGVTVNVGSESTGGTDAGGPPNTKTNPGGKGDKLELTCDQRRVLPLQFARPDILSPTVWEGRIRVTNNLLVSATLTIKPCTVVEFTGRSSLVLNHGTGALVALGGVGEEIIFRGIDQVTSFSGIETATNSSLVLKNVVIQNVAPKIDKGALEIDTGNFAAENITIRDVKGIAINVSKYFSGRTFLLSDIWFEQIRDEVLVIPPDLLVQTNNLRGSDFGLNNFIRLSRNFAGDTILKNYGFAYLLPASIINQATVVAEAGSFLLISSGTTFDVSAKSNLQLMGTAAAPIVISPLRGLFSDSTHGGMNFDDAGPNNTFRHTVMYQEKRDQSSLPAVYISNAGSSKITFENFRVFGPEIAEQSYDNCDVYFHSFEDTSSYQDLGGNIGNFCYGNG